MTYKLFGFGDHSDYKIKVFKSDSKELWHWKIMDEKGVTRLIPPVHGTFHGFGSPDAAEADAREVVEGLGADFKDLDQA